MKKRDIVSLIISVIILLVAGALMYRYFVPPAKDNGVKVEVPRPVETSFSQDRISELKNKTKDFTPDITPTDSAARPIIQ